MANLDNMSATDVVFLDLDLDFFVRVDQPLLVYHGKRLSGPVEVTSRSVVREFLEYQCGLDAFQKIKGNVFSSKAELFFAWENMIKTGEISYPFEIIHVDAHSGLGYNPEFYTILSSFDENGTSAIQPNSENYLLLALIRGWISRLTFVRPNWVEWVDIPPKIVSWIDSRHGAITLRKYSEIDLQQAILKNDFSVGRRIGQSVALEIFDENNFLNQREISGVSLTISPSLTPTRADVLIETICRYMSIPHLRD